MLRWFLGALGVLLIFGGTFGAGVYVGELRAGDRAKDAVIEDLRDENKSIAARAAEEAANAAQVAAEQKALAEWMKANAARSVDIRSELRRAIDAMGISCGQLSADVRRVRQRAVDEVNSAGLPAAGREDRAGLRPD